MRKRQSPHKKIPQAALVAVLSVHLALPSFVRAGAQASAGTILTGTNAVTNSGGEVIDGNNATGYFVKSGSLNISNVTLQNFNTVGGSGSGGGGGFGGALFINGGASVELNNVNFLSNNAVGGNGGQGTLGGTLNNLFSSGTNGSNGANGDDAPGGAAYVNGGNGGNGFNGAFGGNASAGFGGNGGSGGSGSAGSPVTADTIKAGLDVTYDGLTSAEDGTVSGIYSAIAAEFTVAAATATAGAASATAGVTSAGAAPGFTALAADFAGLATAFTTLAGETAGAKLTKDLAKAAFDGAYLTALTVTALAEGASGNGGTGANGGAGGRGSEFYGGGAGGAGGNGGEAYAGDPSIAQGGAGGGGGAGGVGGFGAGGGRGGNGGNGGDSAKGEDGADGAAGAGGAGGFGGGTGASGVDGLTPQAGGNGGNGYGGGIFVRAGATLTITGNALFDGNGVRGGDGQAASTSADAGMSGIGVGTDLFMMKGSTVILDADKYSTGNVITFNGDAYGTSIADDSASSIIPSGGVSAIASGSGASIIIRSGLIQFNGGNLYSGQTKIEGGTLQAQDTEGIYWDSNINFAGTPSSNGVLMMSGDFTRYVGAQSNRVQWTGSGGFAAVDGELNVRLSNGQAMTWGSGSFVPTGSSLIFGSAYATDVVNFANNLNLNGAERTILVVANHADEEAGLDADVDWAVMKGVISNGSLTVGDANHTGTLVLAGINTYTGVTKVAGGTLATQGNERIANTSRLEVLSGARFLLGGNETLAGISGAGTVELGENYTLTNLVTADTVFSGTLAGAGTLVKDGAAKLTLSGTNTHTGTIDIKTGVLDLTGSVESTAVKVASGTTLNSTAGGLADTTNVTNNGTFNVGSVDDTIASLTNTGAINGSSTLTATTYNLNGGSVLNANLGTGTMNTAGHVTINGSSDAEIVNVATGSVMDLEGAERLNDTATVTVNGTMNLNGGAEKIGALAGSGTTNIGANTLTSTGATDSTYSGTINGTGGLTKENTGKLTLSGANTYTGTTKVASGTLATSGNERIANASNLEVQSDGTFSLGGNETLGSISGAGSIVLNGSNVLTTSNTAGVDASVFSGVISGSGTLTKVGLGSLTLSGINTNTGTLNVNAGNIALTGSIDSTTINVAAGAALNSSNGGLSSLANVTNSGTLDIAATDDTIATLLNIGSINGTGTLTAATYNLNNGSVINANLGTGTVNASGTVTFNGTSAAEFVNVALGGILNLQAAERLLNTTALTVNGTMNLNGGNETVGTIAGSGTIDLKANKLTTNASADTTFSGVLAGTGGLDKNGTGKLTLSGTSTYTGVTNINVGTIDLTGGLASTAVNILSGATLNSTNGGLSSGSVVTNAGTLSVGSVNDTISTLNNTGTINGTGTLTATTYNLNNGSVVNANLGAGTLNTVGTVTLHGSSSAATVNVNFGSVLNLEAPELLLNTSTVTVNGTLNLNGGDESIYALLGNGTVNTNAYQLIFTNGGSFQGVLNASNTDLNTGTGGGLVLDGGTTTTQNTTVDTSLTIVNGGTLNSNTISLAPGSVLDLSGGGTINFTTLTSLGTPGGTINIGSNDFIIPVGSSITGYITFIGTGNIINNGTISPGFSPGLTLLPGMAPAQLGAYQAELAGLGGVAGTDFDQIQLTAPGAVLTIGGALNVAGFAGFTPQQGNTFQIVAGAGGALPINPIVGTFATVTFDADGVLGVNPAVANAAVVFDVNTGMLTATGLNGSTSTFADLGSTPNQRAAASAIFNAALIGPNQIDTATTAGQLALQLTDAVSSSSSDLARYVPDYYGAMADYAIQGDQMMARSIQDRVSALNYIKGASGEDSRSQVPEHMSAYVGYTSSHIDTADNASVNRNDYYVGTNILASEDYVLGLAGSMSEGSISAPLGSADSHGFGGMIYGRATVAEDFVFFGSFGMSQQDFDLTRATVNGTVTGSTDATSYVSFLGVQYKGWRVGEVSIAPRLSLTYSNTDVGGFNESGAVDALNVSGYSASRLIGEAGVSALWTTEIADKPFSLEVSASLQQALQDSKDTMTASLGTVPNASYPVEFNSSGDTQAVIRANASYTILNGVNLYGGYEGHYGGETAHYIKAGLRVNF